MSSAARSSRRLLCGAAAGVVLVGSMLTAAVLLAEPDQLAASEAQDVLGVRLPGPVAAGRPVLRAPVASSAPAPAGRNPFLMPSPPAEVADTEPRSAPGPPPGGRNPFLPLVGPVSPDPAPPAPSAPSAPPILPNRPGPVPAELLRRGSAGEGVRSVQQQLRDRGWRVTVDGVMGPQTEAVVRAFQRRRGLVVDGLVGPLTRAALLRTA